MFVGATSYAAGVGHLRASTSVAATPRDAITPQHDEIRLPTARGSFVSLRLQVDGGTVTLERLVVTFAHGSTRDIDLKGKTLEPGGVTPEVPLTGNDHVIRKVDF